MSRVEALLSYSGIEQRLEVVQARIAAAAQRAKRSLDEVTLIAISKTHPAAAIKQLAQSGVTDVGENRVQEAEGKIAEVGRDTIRWHLVGHLQANKVRKAVKLFDVVHSIDSIDLAERFNRICDEEQRDQLEVLIQVELGGEASKSGVKEAELAALAKSMASLERLKLIGLMTLPPFFDDPNATRPYFAELRALRDKLAAEGLFGDGPGELSMGMTNDFEVAIEEGATMVRVGTAIFGART